MKNAEIMKVKIFTGIMSLFVAFGLMAVSCSDNNNSISTKPIISSVTTGNAEVTAVSATVDGTVKDLSGQSTSAYTTGIVYSTDKNNVKAGTQAPTSLNPDGTFKVIVTGLQKNVTYYYATFVTLQGSLSYYGDVKSFVTSDAQVSTADPSSLTANAATLGGTLSNVATLPSNATLGCGVLVSTNPDSIKTGKSLSYSTPANGNFAVDGSGLLPSKTYYCMAYMKLNNGYIYGDLKSFKTSAHETDFVDLGLSVYWAKCNIGGSNPEDAGGLYGYGDTTGLKTSMTDTYGTGADITGNAAYDICAANNTGRLPTFSEVKELLSKCTFTETTVNNVAGFLVKGPNGNSIFMPKSGYRAGDDASDAGTAGYYWTGSINTNSTGYGCSMNLKSGDCTYGNAFRYEGLSIRAVKKTVIAFDNSKLVDGDVEGGGKNYRMEIYNQYGSTKNNSGLNPNTFAFYKKCYVNFTITGLGKLSNPLTAQLYFANTSWSYQKTVTCSVTGDGTYTLEMDGSTTDAGVFVIDLLGAKTAVSDFNDIHGYINSIIVDADNTTSYYTSAGGRIDQSKIVRGDIESNGNYRMDIVNAWGGQGTDKNPPFAYNDISFSNEFAITFKLSGLGTLSKSYVGYLVFCDGSSSLSNWNPGTSGDCTVTGDGTYTVYVKGKGGPSLNVCCVDIVGLAKDVTPSNITSTVEGVYWK